MRMQILKSGEKNSCPPPPLSNPWDAPGYRPMDVSVVMYLSNPHVCYVSTTLIFHRSSFLDVHSSHFSMIL